jgi:hypothetical protein
MNQQIYQQYGANMTYTKKSTALLLSCLLACTSNKQEVATQDTSTQDTNTTDTTVVDSGTTDTSTTDTAIIDTGVIVDTAIVDTGDTGDTGDTITTDTGDTDTSSTSVGALAVMDFSLPDVNTSSALYGQTISPRDYVQQISGWYFIKAT